MTELHAPIEQEATAAPTRTLRIAFPLEGFNVSGGIRVITQIANALAERGHSVRLTVPDYQSTTHFHLHPAVEIQSLATKGTGLRRKLSYLTTLSRTATRHSDVCVATGSRTPYWIMLSRLLNRDRPKLLYLIQHYEVLSHAEQTTKPWLLRKILAALIALGYRLPFQQIAVSHWIQNKIGNPHCHVIPNGVDCTVFQPLKIPTIRRKFTLGIIESASPWKGYGVFLAAINALPEAVKAEISVRIASRNEVELPEGIEAERLYPNNDAAMVAFYQDCDLFVFTSEVEGFGLPPLEAMACGIPVLTTDCGGVREYAREANAILVPPGDTARLTAAIRRLKQDAELRTALRTQGLETAERFSLVQMQKRYVEWIENQ